MERVKVKTANPEALKETLAQLIGGPHVVRVETAYVVGDYYIVTAETANPDFLKFACKNQGYAQIVGDD